MKLRSLLSLAATAAAIIGSPPAHADSSRAIAACQTAVQNDSRFSSARESNAEQHGKGVFKVTGLVKDAMNRDHRYTCRYEHGEVVSYNVTEASVPENNQKAAAIGAGLIGLAAVAALAKHNDDDNHRKSRDSYYRGDNYAFDDRNYLKRECSEEIRAHIDRDHGKVVSIDLQAPYVHDRVMSGTGEVYFRNGGSRELRYTCNFDRNGREFDPHKHPQDYKAGYRDGERARWRK